MNQPKFNLETLEGRKAAWNWVVKRFGNPLIVTKDGVPIEDQAKGIDQFKAAALKQPKEWTPEYVGKLLSSNYSHPKYQHDVQAVADAHNDALAAHRDKTLEVILHICVRCGHAKSKHRGRSGGCSRKDGFGNECECSRYMAR